MANAKRIAEEIQDVKKVAQTCEAALNIVDTLPDIETAQSVLTPYRIAKKIVEIFLEEGCGRAEARQSVELALEFCNSLESGGDKISAAPDSIYAVEILAMKLAAFLSFVSKSYPGQIKVVATREERRQVIDQAMEKLYLAIENNLPYVQKAFCYHGDGISKWGSHQLSNLKNRAERISEGHVTALIYYIHGKMINERRCEQLLKQKALDEADGSCAF